MAATANAVAPHGTAKTIVPIPSTVLSESAVVTAKIATSPAVPISFSFRVPRLNSTHQTRIRTDKALGPMYWAIIKATGGSLTSAFI